MSNKNNNALQVDREAMAQFQVLTSAALAEIESLYDQCKPAIVYLLDDTNIGGGDSKEFKAGIEALALAMKTVGEKFNAVNTSVTKMTSMYGANSTTHKLTLAEARKEMGATLIKLKQAGR